jgi:hypothetical protein
VCEAASPECQYENPVERSIQTITKAVASMHPNSFLEQVMEHGTLCVC